jgi:DNA/RNA endonuclease YhcR with UshA esterase domain
MVRVDGLIAGSYESAWSDATASSGFLDRVADLGTPGYVKEVEKIQEETTEEVVEVVEVVDVKEMTVDDSTDSVVTSDTETTEVVDEVISEETIETVQVEDVATEDLSDSSVPSDASDVSVPSDPVVEEVVEEVDEVEQAEEATEEIQVAEETSAIISYTPGVILINEFVVDPTDDGEEWIELVNQSSDTLTLTNWTVEDATGKKTDLSSLTINPGAYAVVYSPNGKLNNDGDTIILRDATALIIDSVSYGDGSLESPEDGMALARNSSTEFELTETSTPGEVNSIFVAQVVEDVEVTEASEEEIIEQVASGQSDQEETSTPASYTGSTTLRFSSIYPNTTGSDVTEEYIEITNTGTESIDLLGWSIEDGSTDRYSISESQIVEPQGTIKIMRTDSGIALNNTGDTLELLDPNDEVRDTVTYGNAAKGSTYTFMNDAWTWAGTVSVAEAVTTASNTNVAKTVSSTPTSSTSSDIQSRTIEQSKDLSDGTRVRVQGVITALPGVFARQVLYIMDETGGIQIYFYTADFPELTIGQSIYVTGEMSTSHGERRIKIQTQTAIASTQQEATRMPVVISIPEINEAHIGSLITIKGLVQSRENGKLIVEDTGSELVVSLKSDPEIDAVRFERGDRVTVTGVLTRWDGELRIRPRTDEDMVIDESVTSLALAASENGKSLFEHSQSQTGLFLLLVTASTLGLLALYRNQRHRQPRLSAP